MQYFIKSASGDGYKNLAFDELLLSDIKPGEIILYLYINDRAVIIGRNQNPFIECSLENMRRDNVQLVRRVSGGGAVYHDGGNLNYSFIAHKDIYDEKRQTSVIVRALERFGIACEVSGRNDITAQGGKFSGNAFCGRGEGRQHHGTLLISSDLGVFDRYLIPPKQKLEAKGIKSVRARVRNLSEMNPEITVESMSKALLNAFEAEYGKAAAYPECDAARLDELISRHMSRSWLLGETPRFDCRLDHRFTWGTAQLCLSVENGKITAAKLFTDSLDTGIAAETESLLTGRLFDAGEMRAALINGSPYQQEIAAFIADEGAGRLTGG